MYVNEQLYCFW